MSATYACISIRPRRGGLSLPLLLAALPGVMAAGPVAAREPLAGPVPAVVERVIDADTLVVRARIWLDQDLTVRVRVADVDAPELSRPGCAAEREAVRAATGLVERMIGPGAVTLTNIHYGKYAGRVVAEVATREGDIAAALRDAGYDGRAWCE